jgi:hypothetical protein
MHGSYDEYLSNDAASFMLAFARVLRVGPVCSVLVLTETLERLVVRGWTVLHQWRCMHARRRGRVPGSNRGPRRRRSNRPGNSQAKGPRAEGRSGKQRVTSRSPKE